MLELASLGAQVMHSRSIELAQKYQIELYVGLSCSDIKGTYIRGIKNMKLEDKVITGLATSDDDVAITIDIDEDKVVDLFESIAKENISMDMISQTAPMNSIISVSFTIPKEDLNQGKAIVEKYVPQEDILVDENITKLSLVGLGMKHTSGVASKVFSILKKNGIKIKLITTSEIRITCAISSEDTAVAVNEIAKEFNV